MLWLDFTHCAFRFFCVKVVHRNRSYGQVKQIKRKTAEPRTKLTQTGINNEKVITGNKSG